MGHHLGEEVVHAFGEQLNARRPFLGQFLCQFGEAGDVRNHHSPLKSVHAGHLLHDAMSQLGHNTHGVSFAQGAMREKGTV